MSDVEKEDLPVDEAPEIAAPPEEPAAAAPSAPVASPEAPPAAAPAQEAPVQMAPMTISPPSPEQQAAARTQHDAQFYQDLSTKKIQPKTYHDLFHDKSTLGKVGTIFGLMLSGAGAGLTHQPNALLEMMNKEIERDLESQKSDQSNRQNWYRLSMEHEKTMPENAFRTAQAALEESKAAREKALNKNAHIEDLGASANAANAATSLAINYNQDMIDRLPPGPDRDMKQNFQDNVVVPYFLNKAHSRNLAVAQQKSFLDAAAPSGVKGNPPPVKEAPKPGVRYDAYNQAEYSRRAELGRLWGEDAGRIKDAIPVSAQPEIDKQAEELTANRNTYADAVNSFNKVAKMEMAGQAPGVGVGVGIARELAGLIPGHSSANAAGSALKDVFEAERSTQMEALIGKMSRGNVSPDKAREIVESFMPKFYDTPKQREEKFEQLKNHFTSMKEEEAPALKKFNLYYPAPKYTFKSGPIKNGRPSENVKQEIIKPRMGENKL
jgi:hypothetical protein